MDINLFKNRALNKENILTVGSYTFTKADLIGGVNYQQTVNSGEDIVLGSCTSATIEFTLNNMNNLINNLQGQEITWKIRVETSPGVFEDVPMGIFIAEKPTKINDTVMTIKAYDRMIKFDRVVDKWINGLTYPMTLKNYLLSLCSYVGVTLSNTTFLNDNFSVKKTFVGEDVTGRQILKWIAEISAKYAIFNELGQLKLGWYNVVDYNINNSNYTDIMVEDYTVKAIDKLQVQAVENDIGVVIGTGDNAYTIQNNPLFYAETEAEILLYAESIYNAIKDFVYIPYVVTTNANPLLRAGNIFTVTTRKGQVIQAVVMSRGMIGWNDVCSATGNERRPVNDSLNQRIQMLRGKTNTLERTIEQTVSQLYDAETGDISTLTQTVNGFNTRVQTLEANMNFKYQQDTAPLDPFVGDVWFSTSNEVFIVDNLLMTVDNMLQPVDYYSTTLNKSYRWDGSQWQHVEDGAITELRNVVSEVEQLADQVSIKVNSVEYDVIDLGVKVNNVEQKITDEAIVSTVESKSTKYLPKTEALETYSKKSEVTQTIDNLIIEFGYDTVMNEFKKGIATFGINGLRVEHSDFPGQYSEMRADGFVRDYGNGIGTYLNDIYVVKTVATESDYLYPITREVDLSESFRGRDFSIILTPEYYRNFNMTSINSDGTVQSGISEFIFVLQEVSRNNNPSGRPPYVTVNAYTYYKKTYDGSDPDREFYRDITFSLIAIGK